MSFIWFDLVVRTRWIYNFVYYIYFIIYWEPLSPFLILYWLINCCSGPLASNTYMNICLVIHQLLSIRDELFETFRKRQKGVMEREEVQLTADSLHRLVNNSMIVNFGSMLLKQFICITTGNGRCFLVPSFVKNKCAGKGTEGIVGEQRIGEWLVFL